MNLSRVQIAGIAGLALVFVLVFAPVQISMALISMASTAAVFGAIGFGIWWIAQGMKRAEKSAKKAVQEVSAALARADRALRSSDKANDQLVNEYFNTARHHLNDALRYMADSEYTDAERSAESARSALYLVLNALGINDEAVPAPGSTPEASELQ